ncbi:hypothetical protein [Micromonospora costi]|uniref:Nitrate/nitrite sensing protein domain-containing protein n=1 Tax=Micromonospora costi TaxID=1530042 RepID=A0A3B0A1Q3_9ACTN|nr:hypothetical protein [Micromonospora costi]RKN54401.1 hypothetical protein D7193_20670 [Micromonospora costi]
MTVPASRVRPRTARRVVPLLLVVGLLAPLGVLFQQSWRLTDDDRSLAARERLGVAYLRILGPVTDALVDAQSAAVAGRSATGAALTDAVEEVARVDARVGAELRTQERWAGLRAKLEALRDRPPTDPEAAFTAYGEVTDLLLDLHRKVRESSGLIRDPESDSFFLQDAAGRQLPEAMVAAGRLTDLATLAARRSPDDRSRTLAQLAALRVAALTPAGTLVDDLRAAVDRSESADLGGNVLTPLDTYQRAVEALAAASAPTRTGTLDAAPVAGARLDAHAAAEQLQPVILAELDALLAARVDRLDRDRWLVVAAAGLGVLLLAVLAGVLIAAARRARRAAAEARRARKAEDDRTAEAPTWQPGSGEPRPLQPAGRAGDPDAARWGPADAAR